MLRYKAETRPGLVALYDIRPGNGAGQFLQPGARTGHQDHYRKNKAHNKVEVVDISMQHISPSLNNLTVSSSYSHQHQAYLQ